MSEANRIMKSLFKETFYQEGKTESNVSMVLFFEFDRFNSKTLTKICENTVCFNLNNNFTFNTA